jgi:hypothetical protein
LLLGGHALLLGGCSHVVDHALAAVLLTGDRITQALIRARMASNARKHVVWIRGGVLQICVRWARF